jgi:hypothetical protein
VSVLLMTEAAFLQAVRDLAKTLGWQGYHTYRSDRSEPGFPDLVLMRPPLLLFRELKTDTGRLTAPQRRWIEELAACGQDVGVWRPADLRGGRISAELTRARRPTGSTR